jgi:hypothetical protein
MDTLSRLVGGILNGSIRVVDLTMPPGPGTPTCAGARTRMRPEFTRGLPIAAKRVDI